MPSGSQARNCLRDDFPASKARLDAGRPLLACRASVKPARSRAAANGHPMSLAVDIGGSGVKSTLDCRSRQISERGEDHTIPAATLQAAAARSDPTSDLFDQRLDLLVLF